MQHVPGGSAAAAAAAAADLRCPSLSSSGEGNRGGTWVDALLRESPFVLLHYSREIFDVPLKKDCNAL